MIILQPIRIRENTCIFDCITPNLAIMHYMYVALKSVGHCIFYGMA